MRRRLIAGAGGLLLLTGCAHTSATSQGEEVHNLYGIILAMAAFVFVLVEGLLIYSLVRFRAKRRSEEAPPQIFGTNRAVVSFFAFGAVLVSVLFPFGERALRSVLAPEPPGESIRIEAFQWEWTAYYLNEGIFSTGKTLKTPMVLEVPEGVPVHVELISRDVMHGFYIPALLFSRNAIPGHPTRFTFTPKTIGTFPGQCTEFCGLWHSRMTLVLKVVSQFDFADFVKNRTLKAIGGTCNPNGTSIKLVAKNTTWNTSCIAVPRGQPFSVQVANEDEGVDHNFAIWHSLQDAISNKKQAQLFQTGKFPGVATKSFQVTQTENLPPGHYYFQCDVHGVAMAGAFIVK